MKQSARMLPIRQDTNKNILKYKILYFINVLVRLFSIPRCLQSPNIKMVVKKKKKWHVLKLFKNVILFEFFKNQELQI